MRGRPAIMARRTEFQRIAEVFAPLAARASGAFGLTDDAAVIPVPDGHDLVVTKDAIVAGVHYLPDDPADLVARKLMRVNLSDLAAMGARPVGVLTACAFPKGLDEAWIDGFAAGLAADVDAFDCPVLGGDTVSTSGPAVFSLTALGALPKGQALRRAGAQAGDLLVMSGTLGDGALGLLAAQGLLEGASEDLAYLADRYRVPRPRLKLGCALLGRAHAGQDISDGLLQDAGHLCACSGLSVDIHLADLPLSLATRRAVAREPQLLERVVGGGDDYELLFAWPAAEVAALASLASDDVPLTVIGRFGEGPGRVRLLDADGVDVPVTMHGWSHG